MVWLWSLGTRLQFCLCCFRLLILLYREHVQEVVTVFGFLFLDYFSSLCPFKCINIFINYKSHTNVMLKSDYMTLILSPCNSQHPLLTVFRLPLPKCLDELTEDLRKEHGLPCIFNTLAVCFGLFPKCSVVQMFYQVLGTFVAE